MFSIDDTLNNCLQLLPIHKYPEYKTECCKLINSEWKRSEIARMRSLDTSCDDLPISLILVNNNMEILGHCKLAKIPNMDNACFMESVVIDKNKRNCGFGKCLMKHVENYIRKQLSKEKIYLRTRDQVGFYLKLGYSICEPISIYGNCNFISTHNVTTLTYMLKSLWESPTYTAAVVEYSPIQIEEDSFMHETINQNTQNYKSLITSAKHNDADIVVFPEYGLTTTNGSLRTRKEIIPIASVIPDPKNKTNPCILSSIPSVISILKEISCLAKMNEIYVVINLFEKVICNQNQDPECPDDNVYIYNTNVAFDREGIVVARYRKYNLYNESILNRTREPEMSIFLSDFGVRFGIITGNDILFKSPALDLIYKEKITDIIFVNSLPSELPFMSSIQVPFGWSFSNGVNVLMAGYNNPRSKRTGSGIFAARNGILKSLITPKQETQLLVKRIDKLSGRLVRLIQNESDCTRNLIIPEMYNKVPKYIKENFLEIKTLQEKNVSVYKTEILRTMVADHITQHCSNGFCCYFRIKIHIQKRPDYIYRMVVFNGVRPLLGFNKAGVQLCAIIACMDQSMKSCGRREKITKKPLVFHEIEIRALYSKSKNTFQYPTTLQYNMMPLFVQNFSYCEINKSNGKQVIMKINDPISHLLVFGIYGRVMNIDGEPITSQSMSPLFYSFTKLLFIIITILLLVL